MDIYVQKDGQRQGPFTESKIREGIDAGEFGPDDLAWTSGRASWQALSALINLDVNQPPPPSADNAPKEYQARVTAPAATRVVDATMVSPALASNASANETILYQDDNRTSPRVIVSKGRLKVGDNTYSLDDVSNVSLVSQSKFHRQETRLWRRLFWVAVVGAFLIVSWMSVGGLGRSSNAWTNWDMFKAWLFPIAVGVMAVREYLRDAYNKQDQRNCYHDAELTLTRTGTPIKILIGRFPTRAPLDKWELLGGVRTEPLPKETMLFFKNVERVKAISEAVGRAIGKNALSVQSDVVQAKVSETPVQVVAFDSPVTASDSEASRIDTLTEKALKSAVLLVTDDSLSINGVVIPIPATTNPLDILLGAHRRREPHQFYWDDWGIGAWGENRNSLTSFTIYLREDEYWGRETKPRRTFAGKLTVGGVPVTLDTKIVDLVTHKSGLPLTKGSTGCWVNVPFNNFLRDFLHLQSRMTILIYPTQEGTVSSVLFTQPSDLKTTMAKWLMNMIYG